MTPKVGSWVWVPCEVRPGPFDNERMVRVQGGSGEWIGFVPVALLDEPVSVGNARVRAKVLEARGHRVLLQVIGAPVMASLIEAGSLGLEPA